VRIATATGDAEKGIQRGSIWFSAFDPWNTCWRQLSGSFNCFDVAERTGLLSPRDSERLSHAILRKGAFTAHSYNGCFSSFFSEPRVQFLLGHADDPDHLSDTGLAIGSSTVDYLFERCPWQIIPEYHLGVQGYEGILVQDIPQLYTYTPWLSWSFSLDIIGFTPWLGLSTREIDHLLDVIGSTENKPVTVELDKRSLGERIAIPMFANGLQGTVMGLFCGISEQQKNAIHTTLLQFGQTLADAYSEMRLRRFAVMQKVALPLEEMAKEAVCAFSPVSRVILETKQGLAGYKLCNEDNYWGGYKKLTKEELQERSPHGFQLNLPQQGAIYIEPITGQPNLDPDFFRLRLESGFRKFCVQREDTTTADALSMHEVQRRVREFESHMDNGKTSYAKLRQYFVAQQIERDLELCETRITNMRLKSFLEERTSSPVKTGYQISSFLGDVERVFPNKLRVEKTRYGVSLSWKLAP
jgi:hypothetical protein